MQQIGSATTRAEQARARGLDRYQPDVWDRRLEVLAYWLGEGIRLGVPLRTLATASRLHHPERVKRFVRRHAAR